ncbi:DUF3748 domain-containing protein [Lunatimonas salinarum]|uniref:DUF3748 domain-containing protein n=1 Tax=Lunatimonas salinarum TaxID=1774590 RepID=UPI001FD79777|nr:DUF3748 domain-containing protein [Lunatimonas salinarum]
MRDSSICTLLFFIMIACSTPDSYWTERQLTEAPQNHELDHNENFSPDDAWIVYDTRPNPAGIQQNTKIEKVNIQNGETKILYEVSQPNSFGPGVGAVSYHPYLNQVVFIHGPEAANEERPYAGHRRTGVIVDESEPGVPRWMDSRDIVPPFTSGALRGGTHRHQWSADGEWIGFTYNDALMVALENETGEKRDLRTVGVSKRMGPQVIVPSDSVGEQVQGTWFSVLLVPVVPNPRPGTDEISKAYEDWWVGHSGYRKPDGMLQRARAFMGDLITPKGEQLTEVFIVDVPDSIHLVGDLGPLEGTATQMPAPPKGATVRRLTRTADRKYPGIASEPRHWLSSSADGDWISYLAKDDAGVVQVFLVSPMGGEPKQATYHHVSVQSMVRWHPREKVFTYVCDNSLFLLSVSSEGDVSDPTRLTKRSAEPPFAPCWSRDGQRIAFNRYVLSARGAFIQVFLAEKLR